MQSVILTWKKIGTWNDLLSNHITNLNFVMKYNSPGVYFWVENGCKGRFSNYVGLANISMIYRNIDHITSYLNLDYSIPKEYRNCGLRYIGGANYPENEKEELLRSTYKYLSHLEIYFAPVDKEILNSVEKTLIWQLVPVENVTYTAKNYSCIEIKHEGELSNEDCKILVEEAVNILSIDSTRPNKRAAIKAKPRS